MRVIAERLCSGVRGPASWKQLQDAGRVAGLFLFLSGGVPADLRARDFR
jgi:hypothetical protein